MSPDIGEVYPLLPDAEGEYPTKELKRPGYCAHRRTQFNTTSRRIHCVACEAEVDAFDVLVAFAKDRERLDAHRDYTIRLTRLAEARLAEILRQERNAKARLKRTGVALDGTALRTAEHEASEALPRAPRVSYGAIDPTTVKAPDSTEAADSESDGAT